jgi:hypothetical protein
LIESGNYIWRPRSLRPGDPDPSQTEGEWKVTRGAPQVVEGVPRIHLPSACRFSSFAPSTPRCSEAPRIANNASWTLRCHPQTAPGTGRLYRPSCGASAPAAQAPETK